MNRFLNEPNLPKSRVKCVITANEDKSLINALNELGISVIPIDKSPDLEPYIASHADAGVYYLGNGQFFADKCRKSLIDRLIKEKGYVKVLNGICSPYPNDCLLNCADIGDFVICNSDCAYKGIIDFAKAQNKTILHTKQGYAKCSVCIVKRNTIITDDASIYNACAKHREISALLIEKGSVLLKNMNYGFIGGCTGLINRNLLFFNGELNYHSNADLIIDFLKSHNVSYVDIKNKPLTDIGSIIPIKEEVL